MPTNQNTRFSQFTPQHLHIPESRIRIRREHFPALKNQTFFLLAIIRNIRMFCKTENRKQYGNAPILAIQVNMKWLCCWQFLWMNRPISMKTIFSYMCFYNHLPNTTFRYFRHFAKHKYSQKIRTQSQDVFGVGNLIATHTFIGKEYRHVSANCSQVISTQRILQLRLRHFIQRSYIQNVAV